jgi:hypothetical protein
MPPQRDWSQTLYQGMVLIFADSRLPSYGGEKRAGYSTTTGSYGASGSYGGSGIAGTAAHVSVVL